MSPPVGRLASLAARTGGSVVRRVLAAAGGSSSGSGGGRSPGSGWLAVTVFCEPSAIDPADLPAPLAAYGGRIEVRRRPAPGGKGTELAVRPTTRPTAGSAASRLSGTDAVGPLRAALREAKQLIEVGEVLAVDPAPHGERTATPGGALLEAWTRVAPRAGVR